jgi:hypothetical protein
MILRRVIQHVRKQEWTAIFIDLVIVVVGVFIGIQVSNWNTEREMNRRAVLFSERLKADLRYEAWTYDFLIEYNKDILANTERVLAAMSGDGPLSDEQFVIAAYRASQYAWVDRRRATYDELISTGTIGMITDQRLRLTAVTVFESPMFEQIFDEGKQAEYRELFRTTVAAGVQRALLARCGDRFVPELDYARIVKSLDYPCTLELPEGKIQAAAQALRSMARLVPALQLRFADVETTLTNMQKNNPILLQNLREFSGGRQ